MLGVRAVMLYLFAALAMPGCMQTAAVIAERWF
jgi:hypothetical protein